MKTKILALIALLSASLAGCGIRCLSSTGSPQSKAQTTGTDDQINVRPVGYQGADAGQAR